MAEDFPGLDLVLPSTNKTVLSSDKFQEQIETAAGRREYVKICRALFKESCSKLAEYIDFSPWQIDSDWYKNIPPYHLPKVRKNYRIDVPYYCTGKGERAEQIGATVLYNWRDRHPQETFTPNATELSLLNDLNRLKREYHFNICKQNILFFYFQFTKLVSLYNRTSGIKAKADLIDKIGVLKGALNIGRSIELGRILTTQLRTGAFEEYTTPTVWGFFNVEGMCDRADTFDPTHDSGLLSRVLKAGVNLLDSSSKSPGLLLQGIRPNPHIMTPKEVREWERRPGEPEWAQHFHPRLRKLLNPAAFPPSPSGPIPDNCGDERLERNGGPWVGGGRRTRRRQRRRRHTFKRRA